MPISRPWRQRRIVPSEPLPFSHNWSPVETISLDLATAMPSRRRSGIGAAWPRLPGTIVRGPGRRSNKLRTCPNRWQSGSAPRRRYGKPTCKLPLTRPWAPNFRMSRHSLGACGFQLSGRATYHLGSYEIRLLAGPKTYSRENSHRAYYRPSAARYLGQRRRFNVKSSGSRSSSRTSSSYCLGIVSTL